MEELKMTINEKINAIVEKKGFINFAKCIVFDDDSADTFANYVEKYYPKMGTFTAHNKDSVIGSLTTSYALLPGIVDMMSNYVTEKSVYADNIDLEYSSIPKDKYIYAVLTNLGRAGVIYQISNEESFTKKKDYPGYISEEISEELKKSGFESVSTGTFKTTMKLDDADEIISKVADFSSTLQDFIKDNGDYLELDLDPVESSKEKTTEKEETEEEAEDEDESTTVSAFFGFTIRKASALSEEEDEDEDEESEDPDAEESESEDDIDEDDMEEAKKIFNCVIDKLLSGIEEYSSLPKTSSDDDDTASKMEEIKDTDKIDDDIHFTI